MSGLNSCGINAELDSGVVPPEPLAMKPMVYYVIDKANRVSSTTICLTSSDSLILRSWPRTSVLSLRSLLPASLLLCPHQSSQPHPIHPAATLTLRPRTLPPPQQQRTNNRPALGQPSVMGPLAPVLTVVLAPQRFRP